MELTTLAECDGAAWGSLAQPPPSPLPALAQLAAHEKREQLPAHGRLCFLFLEPGAQQEPEGASGLVLQRLV